MNTEKYDTSEQKTTKKFLRLGFGSIVLASSLALTQSGAIRTKVVQMVEKVAQEPKNPENVLSQNQDFFVDFENNLIFENNFDAEKVKNLHIFAEKLTSHHENTAFRRFFLAQILQESRWNPSPKNSSSSAIGLGQIIWREASADMAVEARAHRYRKILMELYQKDATIFEVLPEDLQIILHELPKNEKSFQNWEKVIAGFEKNLENPEVNLLLSYIILRLKLGEVTTEMPEKGVLYEKFYTDYKTDEWKNFLGVDYENFAKRVENMSEDEIKMLVATGRYNGNTREIISPTNDFIGQNTNEENKNILPEYIQHMNRISLFADDYYGNFAKFSHFDIRHKNMNTLHLKME